jgi:hypothetical protein
LQYGHWKSENSSILTGAFGSPAALSFACGRAGDSTVLISPTGVKLGAIKNAAAASATSATPAIMIQRERCSARRRCSRRAWRLLMLSLDILLFLSI